MVTDGFQRREEARRKRRRTTFQIVLLLVLFALSAYLVFGTSLFLVTSIEFLDAEYVDVNLLATQSQLKEGEHIFFVDTGLAVRELKKLGYVKEVSIVRIFPNKIKVYITPRHPELVVKAPTQFIYIDGGGVVAQSVESSQRWDLPLVTGLENQLVEMTEAKAMKLDPAWLGKDVLASFLVLKEKGLSEYVSEFHGTSEGWIVLYTRGGSVIKTTGSENITSKIDFLFTYLKEKDDRMIIDLTHGGNPTYTPR